MEEDTLFEELKQYVELTRRKIRRCMVVTENQAETKISWNLIWNELQKTDLQVSTEMKQRLKVWYLLRETFSAPKLAEANATLNEEACDRQQNRDLSHTLPAFMIESLVQPEDRWGIHSLTDIASKKPCDYQQKGKFGDEQKDALHKTNLPVQNRAIQVHESRIEGQFRSPRLKFSGPQSLETLGYNSRKPNYVSQNYPTLCETSQRQSYRRNEIQSRQHALKKQKWCPPVNILKAETPSFIPRSHQKFNQNGWIGEVNTNGFNCQNNHSMKLDVPRTSCANHFALRPDDVENRNPNNEFVPWRAPSRKYQLRRMYVENPNVKHGRSRWSSSYKNNFCQLDMENTKVDQQFYPPLNETKWNAHRKRRYKLRVAFQKQKNKRPYPPNYDSGKPEEHIFPPHDYAYEEGDWIVHAILSLSVKPRDVRVALEDRGYELKYITKRRCTLPKKWVCSLIASADRTHILTSENILINSWEVEFTCNQEEITPFLI